MAPILVVLALLALGVGIVAWFTRHTYARPYAQRRDQDTAWNDPVSPAAAASARSHDPFDPFAHAPDPADLAPTDLDPRT